MDLPTLMVRIKDGDKAAFEALYKHYSKMVYHIAFAQCGDNGLSLEVVREVFRQVYAALCKAPYRGDFCVWLTALTAAELKARREARAQAPIPAPEGAGSATGWAEIVPQPEPVPQPKPAVAKPVSAPEPSFAQAAAPRPAPLDSPAVELADEPHPAPGGNAGAVLGIVLLSLLALGLLWVLAGLLMGLDVLPKVELGYAWFNAHVLDLF